MSSLVSNEDGHDCWRSTFLNQNNPPGYLKDEEDRSLCTDAAKERNSEAAAWVAGIEDGADMEVSVAETVKTVGKEDQPEAGVNKAGDAEWVFVPHSEELKGEYRQKMVQEVLPELMDFIKLESAPLMRFGGKLIDKGKTVVGEDRVGRLFAGTKALLGKFEALREKKARYEFR